MLTPNLCPALTGVRTRQEDNKQSRIPGTIPNESRLMKVRGGTHVAPKMNSSMVLEFARLDTIACSTRLERMRTTILVDMLLMQLEITTGARRRSVMNTTNIALAVNLIKEPE
jgi:hypothetical protein